MNAYKHDYKKRQRLKTSKARRMKVDVVITPGVSSGAGYLAEACLRGRPRRSCAVSRVESSPTKAVSKALSRLAAKLRRR